MEIVIMVTEVVGGGILFSLGFDTVWSGKV